MILSGVAGLAHLGTVDARLIGWLLVGSVPGVLVESRLISVVAVLDCDSYSLFFCL